jgi:lysophospholipase L1-like esterase
MGKKKHAHPKPDQKRKGSLEGYPTAPTHLRKFLFPLFTAAVVLTLLLIPAELVARRITAGGSPPEKQNVFLCQPAADPDMTFMLVPNSNFVTFGVPFTTNEWGFRDRPTQPKTANMFRILCIGDSVTYGTGVSNEDTFPHALQSMMLQRAGALLDVDVINGGVSAYNTRNVRGLLETVIDTMAPDVVVYTFVENDLDDSLSSGPGGWLMECDPQKPPDSAFIKGSFAPAWVMRWEASRKEKGSSAIGQLFSQWFRDVPDVVPPLIVGNHPEARRRWEEAASELAGMRDLCAKRNARFLVYSFGTRDHSEPPELRLRQICRQLAIPEASTLPLFERGTYAKKHSLGYDPHCNPNALQLMASRLYTFLEDEKVVPPLLMRAPSDRQTYEEAIDPSYSARLEQESFEAPKKVVPGEAEGMIAVLGGLDLDGRMARNCIVRLGGRGNCVEVDANALFKEPQALSARIEGGSPTAPIRVSPQTMRLTFPIPQPLWDCQIEVELIAGGPAYIPPPEERIHGADPYTLAIHRIARANQ